METRKRKRQRQIEPQTKQNGEELEPYIRHPILNKRRKKHIQELTKNTLLPSEMMIVDMQGSTVGMNILVQKMKTKKRYISPPRVIDVS